MFLISGFDPIMWVYCDYKVVLLVILMRYWWLYRFFLLWLVVLQSNVMRSNAFSSWVSTPPSFRIRKGLVHLLLLGRGNSFGCSTAEKQVPGTNFLWLKRIDLPKLAVLPTTSKNKTNLSPKKKLRTNIGQTWVPQIEIKERQNRMVEDSNTYEISQIPSGNSTYGQSTIFYRLFPFISPLKCHEHVQLTMFECLLRPKPQAGEPVQLSRREARARKHGWG